MDMPSGTRRWTAEEARALPDDGNRYEVIDGELLVTPAPVLPHQRAVRELMILLHRYLTDGQFAEVLASPADVSLEPDSVVQPDLFVLPMRESFSLDWHDLGPLLLVVEVLSSKTARRDRFVKRRHYQRAGIPEYWIVDLDARAIERWRPDDERPEVLGERITWQPDATTSALEIDLVSYFGRVFRT